MRREDADVVETDDVVVVHASGEFDLLSAGTLGFALRRAASRDKDVVLDLGAATFVDVISMRVVVQARDRVRTGGHRLVLRNPSPLAERLAELLGARDLVQR
jgi:anti-anti-sigma factor